MTWAGLDIGGSKIELRSFDRGWREIHRSRLPTPLDYDDFLAAIAALVTGAEAEIGPLSGIGVGTAGRIDPASGRLVAANLCAAGQPLQIDIEARLNRPVSVLNDAAAFALSEAVFGAGRGQKTVLALILGTGVGGAVVVDGQLRTGLTGLGGEFGHMAAPAHLLAPLPFDLPLCGCGRTGCIETLISARGLERLARQMTGQNLTAQQITKAKTGDMSQIWSLWCALTAELIHTLTLTIDPDIIVLGGGLSTVPGLAEDLSAAAAQAQIRGFATPPLAIAEGGDASGARGAAYAAARAAGAERPGP